MYELLSKVQNNINSFISTGYINNDNDEGNDMISLPYIWFLVEIKKKKKCIIVEASKQNNLFILLYICTEPMHHSILSPCAFNIISKQNYSCFCCLTEMNCTLRLASSKRLCRGCIRGCLHGVRKILALGRTEKAEKRFVCFTCRNFGRSGYQVDKEKKINCRP